MRLRDTACDYGLLGWAVLPLLPRSKRPDASLAPRGRLDATSYLPTLLHWWERQPQNNIGIDAEKSGLLVLDIDPRNGGDDTLAELIAAHGELPVTPESFTGGGGQHLLFTAPEIPLRGSLGPGVDLKHAGYIVAPPSMHESGRRYEWSVDAHPEDVAVAFLPASWIAKASRQEWVRRPGERVYVPSDDPVRQIPARSYVQWATGRRIDADGWMQCPFHKDGKERTPSFKCEGTLWSCFACEPLPGQQVCGGNIYTFFGLLQGYPMPLTGADFEEVRAMLVKVRAG